MDFRKVLTLLCATFIFSFVFAYPSFYPSTSFESGLIVVGCLVLIFLGLFVIKKKTGQYFPVSAPFKGFMAGGLFGILMGLISFFGLLALFPLLSPLVVLYFVELILYVFVLGGGFSFDLIWLLHIILFFLIHIIVYGIIGFIVWNIFSFLIGKKQNK